MSFNRRTPFIIIGVTIVCVAILLFSLSRLVYSQGRISLFYLVPALLAGGLLSGGAVFWLLERRTLSRLRALSARVSQIGLSGDLAARLSPDRWGQEFSGLITAINQMLDARQEWEQMLRLNQTRYRLVVESARITIYDWDLVSGQIVWNDNLKSIFGYEDNLVPNAFTWRREHIHPEDWDRVVASIFDHIEYGRGVWSDEYRLRRRDGSYAHVEEWTTFMRDEAGHPVRAVGAVMDVSERKQIQHEQEKLRRQLLQAQKMEVVGRLTAGIAHDFNNLLTVINGFADLLRSQLPETGPDREAVDRILEAGRRATDLVRRLLVFSRKQVVAPRVLNLNTVIADMDKMLRRIIGEDVVLETRLDPDLGLLKADEAQLEQVILNLVVNARDAMPDGGALTIATTNVTVGEETPAAKTEAPPGDYIRLTVADTGIGMTEEITERLFEPFFTTKAPGKGTGLGLATVFGVVSGANGYISVHSRPGEGTTFVIDLPRTRETPARPVAEPAIDQLPPGAGAILLVEDAEGIRELARFVLQKRGYTILEAANGREALQLHAGHAGQAVRLLISDLVMPEMSGVELAGQLLKRQPDLKILFTSGYTDRSLHQPDLFGVQTAFLAKPFTPATLARKVQEVLAEA